MAYATVADVENRLGVTFAPGDSQSVETYLQDLSLVIDKAIIDSNKVPETFDEALLKMFCARKGVDFYLWLGRDGASTFSEAVGDVSRSASFSSSGNPQDLRLSGDDLLFLGISKNSGFVTWTLTNGGC